MADIEKINVNNTDYDVKDAKALHNKALATSSIVEEKAGTTSYPSNGANNTNNVILGNGAYVVNANARNAVVIGSNAKFSFNNSNSYYSTGVGYNCTCGQNYSTAIGSQAYAYTNGTALGANASTGGYTTNTVIGYNAAGGATYATALGGGAKAYKSYDVALGYNAITNGDSYSIQIGAGTNTNGGLQVRSWQLLNNQGIIPIERIPTDLVVTTTDPLPDPDALSVGTTQMYLGEDTETYKKNHMYSVQEDRTSNCVFVMPYDAHSIVGFDPIKNVKIVDKAKLYNSVTNYTGFHGGKPKDISSSGMWNNKYISLYYNPATDKFYLGPSYEYKVETLYYDYTNGSPELTLRELENDYGIRIEGWDTITKPTYSTSFAYIVLNSQFCVQDVNNPDYNHRFEMYARMGYDKLKQWCESPITYIDGSGPHQYRMQNGDKIEIRWFANTSINPDEGGAWWLVLYKEGQTTQFSINPPQDGQHSLYNYWTTDELKRDWGITDVGQGLYAGRTYINNTTFTVCWVYGNRWVEATVGVTQEDLQIALATKQDTLDVQLLEGAVL